MSLTVTFTGTGGFAPPPSGSIAAPKIRILLYLNAKPAASQSGGLGNAQGAYQKAITIASVGSAAVGAIEAGPATTSLTADALSTMLDNIQDNTNGIRHGSFVSSALTATTGSKTYGSSTAFAADGTVCVAEIQAQGGTLTRDSANEPAVKTSTTGNAATTDPFDPQPGSLIVALVDGVCTGGGMSDNTGGKLTWGLATQLGTDGYTGIFLADYRIVSGTGSVGLKKPSLSATATGSTSGTGSVALKKPSLSGISDVLVSGTGSVSLKKPGLSATGVGETSGTGSVDLKKPGLSGSGTVSASNFGSVALKKMSLLGAGVGETAGTGSVALKKPNLSATATGSTSGTGSVALKKPSLSISAILEIPGTGSVALKKLKLSSSGIATNFGSGSVDLKKPELSGSGDVTSPGGTGTGGVTLKKPSILGFSNLTIVGTGGVTLSKMRFQSASQSGSEASSLFIFSPL